jgi:hypothetical protein
VHSPLVTKILRIGGERSESLELDGIKYNIKILFLKMVDAARRSGSARIRRRVSAGEFVARAPDCPEGGETRAE